VRVRAPGRVNLIGEHTDYNGGLVMPCGIPYDTRVEVTPRNDSIVNAGSESYGTAHFDLNRLPSERRGDWSDYVRGMLIELRDASVPLRGANLAIAGNVPIGVGLSSSASLEIAAALALLAAAEVSMEVADLAVVAQRAENLHAGTHCGIMDQFAILAAKEGCALLLDTKTLAYETLELPANVTIVICDTMVRRGLASSAYNERRRECEEAVRLLKKLYSTIEDLCDVLPADLDAARTMLTPRLFRRARHVVSENQRVQAAAEALRRGYAVRFGQLMNASHESLCTDYEVSCMELDMLANLARAFPGVYGARMTGGGFGGCTVNLVETRQAPAFRAYIAEAYETASGVRPRLYDGTPSRGAEILRERVA
jgi:galactokinase